MSEFTPSAPAAPEAPPAPPKTAAPPAPKSDWRQRYAALIDSLDLEDSQKDLLRISWLEYFIHCDTRSRVTSFRYKALQAIIITSSVLIPVLEGSKLNGRFGGLSMVAILAFMIALSSGWLQFSKYGDHWRHYRKNAELLRSEGEEFFALSGRYVRHESHRSAFKDFVRTLTLQKRREVESFMETSRAESKGGQEVTPAQGKA